MVKHSCTVAEIEYTLIHTYQEMQEMSQDPAEKNDVEAHRCFHSEIKHMTSRLIEQMELQSEKYLCNTTYLYTDTTITRAITEICFVVLIRPRLI